MGIGAEGFGDVRCIMAYINTWYYARTSHAQSFWQAKACMHHPTDDPPCQHLGAQHCFLWIVLLHPAQHRSPVELPVGKSRKLAPWSSRELSFTSLLSSVQLGQKATPTLKWYENQRDKRLWGGGGGGWAPAPPYRIDRINLKVSPTVPFNSGSP